MSGTAEILAEYNRREGELIQANSLDRIPALGPKPQKSHGGNATDEIKSKVGNEVARTIPGCPDQGRNCEIKDLNQSSQVSLLRHVLALYSASSATSISPGPMAGITSVLPSTISSSSWLEKRKGKFK